MMLCCRNTGDRSMTCLKCSTTSQMGVCIIYSLLTFITHSVNNSPITHFNTYTMGFFKGSAPQQLLPVNPPVGVYPNFIAKVPTVLTLKESLFSLSGVSCRSILSCGQVSSLVLMYRMTLLLRMVMGIQ
jgi:hypothetical protein